jgi:hypothetical protein
MHRPPPRRRPLSPASAAALADALVYPLHGAALAALLTTLALRLPIAALPLFWPPLVNGLLWLAFYKFALECMAATAQGRHEAPDVLAHMDDSIHRRHLWVQMALLGVLVAVVVLRPEQILLAAALVALVLPGMIFALAIGQNLLAALNPLNWAVVAGKLGPVYLGLGLLWLGVVLAQFAGASPWLALGLPTPLAHAGYYLLTQYLVLVLFRWMGLALFAQAERLGYEIRVDQRPMLQREREVLAVARDIAAARESDDPEQRADRLREAIRLGAAEPVQREYRSALRAAGRLPDLDAHARVRCAELVALGELKAASALAVEALQDNPKFSLPESEPLNLLLDHLERLAQWRSASTLARNYRASYPKRRDSLGLAARAAGVLADHLGEPDSAAELLAAAIEQAVPLGEEAPLLALRQRLANRLPLRASAPPAQRR